MERAVLLAEGRHRPVQNLPGAALAARPVAARRRPGGREPPARDLSLKRAMRELEEATSAQPCAGPGATAPAPRRCWRSATGRCCTRSKSTGSTPDAEGELG